MRVAWSSRPPCSIVAGYACSHPFMVFNRVVSLLAVDLVVVGSLENSWADRVYVSLGTENRTLGSPNPNPDPNP